MAEPHQALITQPVDPKSPVPLYYQVETDLRQLMETRKLKPGMTLPPEHALCDQYGVSRHTIRMALSRLAADNLIARTAGKGTVVQPRMPPERFYLDRSFTRQMAELGLVARSKILSKASGQIGFPDAELLQVSRKDPCLRLSRLRYGNNEPVGLQHSTILTKSCPELKTKDLKNRSLYEVLSSDFNLDITEIQHTISATAADEDIAEHLHLDTGDPLLVVCTTAYLPDKSPIEFTRSFYRADRYEYSTVYRRQPL